MSSINIFLVYLNILAGSVPALITRLVDLSGLFWGIGFAGGIAFNSLIWSWLDDYL